MIMLEVSGGLSAGHLGRVWSLPGTVDPPSGGLQSRSLPNPYAHPVSQPINPSTPRNWKLYILYPPFLSIDCRCIQSSGI